MGVHLNKDNKMYKSVLAILGFLACTEAAKIAKLIKDEPVVYCGVTDLIACAGEIETAWDKCSAAGSVDDVLECIQDILGASDCIDCVSEVEAAWEKCTDSFDIIGCIIRISWELVSDSNVSVISLASVNLCNISLLCYKCLLEFN